MRHFILFLLLSSTAYTQNYHYGLESKSNTDNSDTEAPTIPLNFLVSNVGSSSVTLAWTASTDNVAVKNYRIYNHDVLLTSVGNVTSLSLPGLTSNTTYNLTLRAVDTNNNESNDSNSQGFTTTAPPLMDNMYEEDDYLNAYFYPLAGSSVSGLQAAIDTYGTVRLEAGNYGTSAQMLYIDSNKKLYGVPTLTKTARITIKEGSSGIVINGINPSRIFFEQSSPIINNTIKNISGTRLQATGASVENNTIINLTGGVDLDFSTSGYFRNNTIIKHWMHATSPQFTLKGNTTTPSYGNLQIWINNLTPHGDGNIYDTVQDVTIIGLDAEGWNLNGKSDKAMTYMRNMGDVKISDFGGGNSYSPVKTPPFDIQAENLYLLNSNLNNHDTNNNSKVRANTNVFISNGNSRYDLEAGGYNFNLSKANTAVYNDLALTSRVTDPITLSNMKRMILGEEKTPIARPNLETIPNLTGVNWAADRVGQTDQTAYIQGLIDANNIAELPEGIYYVGSSLKLKGQNQGIKGAGTGKTAIVGLTDDFPLITFSDIGTNRRWFVSNLTLQGGHTGFVVQKSSEAQMMVTGVAMHDVIFRDQTYGMHLNRFYGLDNNFFENINFINCSIGLFQDPDPAYSGGATNTMMYLDKNVFYKTQVINCGVGFMMNAQRANNLNSWVDCVFDGNGIAVDLSGSNHSNFVNCDFKNHTGNYVIGKASPLSLYSCNFSNNNTSSIFRSTLLTMEGCTLSDNVPLLVKMSVNPIAAYIQNSTITGNLGYYTNGVISNSILKNNTSLNKLLVHIINGKVTTILPNSPTPYPQYLVKY